MASLVSDALNFPGKVVDKICQPISRFLDKHPIVYKVVLVASHIFRAAAMYGLMVISPLPLPVTCGVIIAGSFLYRAAVERFCCFHFALPSCVGAGTYWFSRASLIQIFSRTAFASLNTALWSIAGALPLIGYLAYVVYISHTEYEAKMGRQQTSCGKC